MPELFSHVSEPHLIAIGRVTTYFAFLEHELAMFCWGLLGSGQRVGQSVTAQLPFGRLVALVSTLAAERIREPGLLEELDGILSRAHAVEAERNTIAHSTWFGEVDGRDVARLKFTAHKGKGRQVQFLSVKSEDIEAIAQRLAAVAGDVMTFSARTGFAAGYIDADS